MPLCLTKMAGVQDNLFLLAPIILFLLFITFRNSLSEYTFVFQAEYEVPLSHPLTLTSEVNTIPNTFPYPPCPEEGCYETLSSDVSSDDNKHGCERQCMYRTTR
ncbi:hypothetical protein NP493_37g05031 [Ridgeia piscesae]|uniref:Uncharacterized protein n=1 Tax=Ridgeia piscesae TaxID=27915 RepID=A0AAD9UK36_RIDPI|nr:hypothetical protein NP493_37g05031 [Ridgeia piscesae]